MRIRWQLIQPWACSQSQGNAGSRSTVIFSPLVIQSESHIPFAGKWGIWRRSSRSCMLHVFSWNITNFLLYPNSILSSWLPRYNSGRLVTFLPHHRSVFYNGSIEFYLKSFQGQSYSSFWTNSPLSQPQPTFLLGFPLPCVLMYQLSEPDCFLPWALCKIPKACHLLLPQETLPVPFRVSRCTQVPAWSRHKGHHNQTPNLLIHGK